MKKSWKSAANFNTDIPKFTPFQAKGILKSLEETDFNESKLETTRTTVKPTSPSPSAETLINRLSSKIKAPSKLIVDVYNIIPKEANKKPDFGSFEENFAQDVEPEIPQKSYSEALHEADRNQIDISQILHDLTEEHDKENLAHGSINNESEDVIEVHENESTNSTQYKLGSLMNVTVVDGIPEESLVNVNVDPNTLKQIFTGSCSRSTGAAFTGDDKLMNYYLFLSSQMNFRSR